MLSAQTSLVKLDGATFDQVWPCRPTGEIGPPNQNLAILCQSDTGFSALQHNFFVALQKNPLSINLCFNLIRRRRRLLFDAHRCLIRPDMQEAYNHRFGWIAPLKHKTDLASDVLLCERGNRSRAHRRIDRWGVKCHQSLPMIFYASEHSQNEDYSLEVLLLDSEPAAVPAHLLAAAPKPLVPVLAPCQFSKIFDPLIVISPSPLIVILFPLI
jgi:hypothetical protein